MKTEDLKAQGLTDEQINFVMAENGKDITKEQQKYQSLEAEKNNYKEQLETAQTSLKEFEGVDIKELQTKIAELNTNLQAKETEYQQKITDMKFDNELKDAITQFGGRSVKSVMAELDIDTLKASQNRNEDIKNALELCKEKHGFLFGSDEPINNANVGPTPGEQNKNANLNVLRNVMGLEPIK